MNKKITQCKHVFYQGADLHDQEPTLVKLFRNLKLIHEKSVVTEVHKTIFEELRTRVFFTIPACIQLEYMYRQQLKEYDKP